MDIAHILFPMSVAEPFDYAIPDGLLLRPGDYVMAPLGKKQMAGVVWAIDQKSSAKSLKTVSQKFDMPPISHTCREFIDWTASYVCAPKGMILRLCMRTIDALYSSPQRKFYALSPDWQNLRPSPARARIASVLKNQDAALTLSELESLANVSASAVKAMHKGGGLRTILTPVDRAFPRPNKDMARSFPLTPDQSAAFSQIAPLLGQDHTILIDGVTGSGKTEVYLEIAADILHAQPEGQILVLLPEIALTHALMERFTNRFGAAPVAWHSSLTPAQKRRAWREIAKGQAQIIVGARSALFLPYPNLRLIIIDEEHDTAFKQEEGVIYHARDLAVKRAKLEKIPAILASATPSLESLINVQQGRYQHISLVKRVGSALLPDITLIDLKSDKLESGAYLSGTLLSVMKDRLESGEQSLLYLNRRGYAPLVLCVACGEKLKSPGTDSWLVEHRYSGRLICHLTGFSMLKPKACPYCGAKDSLRGVGPGVERIAEEVRLSFPQARTEIFSSDLVTSPKAANTLITRMEEGKIDILIGTQMVAKGHNFPNLTLVGIVDADSGLQGGDLRAGERNFQLIHQVAGRAGRYNKKGLALIQTHFPDHPLMQAIKTGTREDFLSLEMNMRKALELPPFGRMAALIITARNRIKGESFLQKLSQNAPKSVHVKLWGPAPAPISILRGRHRWRFLIQSARNTDLSAYMREWVKRCKISADIKLSVDIDPYSFL